jgi:hypothetical protein
MQPDIARFHVCFYRCCHTVFFYHGVVSHFSAIVHVILDSQCHGTFDGRIHFNSATYGQVRRACWRRADLLILRMQSVS